MFFIDWDQQPGRNPMPIGSTKHISAKGLPVYELPIRKTKSAIAARKARAERRRAERRQAEGFCKSCTRRRGKGSSKWYCADCLAREREQARARQQIALEKGLCDQCHTRPRIRALCAECLESRRKRENEIAAARRAEGCCLSCGAEVEKYSRCLECRVRRADLQRGYDAKRRNEEVSNAQPV